MNVDRETGAILIVSENTTADQMIRSLGSVMKHDDIDSIVIVNRSWNSIVQDRMNRLPRLYRGRLRLAKTSDPLQELRRWLPDMKFTLVLDTMATLDDHTIGQAVDELNGPGDRAVIGAIHTRPRWAGALYRTDVLQGTHGIDLSDQRSVLAAVRDASWALESGLAIRERPFRDLGRESLRRLPDLFGPRPQPVPRAGNDIVPLKSRRRTRR